jgi:hypothetical protein
MYPTNIPLERETFDDRRLEHTDTDVALRTLAIVDLGFVHQVLAYARRQGGTRIDASDRIATSSAEDLFAVMRHGPLVVDSLVYRRVLRARCEDMHPLRTAGHKQSIRPSRLSDAAFLDYH